VSQHSDKRAFTHIRAAIYGEPWAILPSGLDLICSIAETHAGGDLPETFAAAVEAGQKRKSKMEMRGNVAVIPITGPIFPKANLMTALSGATAASDINAMLDDAWNNKVDGIALAADSPGGVVQGGLETADKIYNLRKKGMPIITSIEGQCHSMAYWIGSQADQMFATRGSMMGSISIIKKFASDDRAMRNEGVDPMTITSGGMKQLEYRMASAGGGSIKDMNALMAGVLEYHAMFVDAIKRSRPKMDAEGLATGDTWIATQAVKNGVIDGIASLDEVVSMLA